MRVSQPFRYQVVLSGIAALLLAVALLAPLSVSYILHQTHMAEAGTWQDVLMVCLLRPTLLDWSLLLLLSLPSVALIGSVLACVTILVRQWCRTRKFVRSLLAFSVPLPISPIAPISSIAQQNWVRYLFALGLEGKVDLIDVERPIAFCYGWLRPRICISTGIVSGLLEEEVVALLLHERYHMVNRDPLKTSVSGMLSAVFFFLPVIRALREQYIVNREIEADRHVMARQHSDQPLLSALYKLMVRHSQRPQHALGVGSIGSVTAAIAGYADRINQRLDFLLLGILPSRIQIASVLCSATILAAMLVLAALATWNTATNTLWHQTYCNLSTCPIMR